MNESSQLSSLLNVSRLVLDILFLLLILKIKIEAGRLFVTDYVFITSIKHSEQWL